MCPPLHRVCLIQCIAIRNNALQFSAIQFIAINCHAKCITMQEIKVGLSSLGFNKVHCSIVQFYVSCLGLIMCLQVSRLRERLLEQLWIELHCSRPGICHRRHRHACVNFWAGVKFYLKHTLFLFQICFSLRPRPYH